MTDKEKILAIKTYEEFDKRRNEFDTIDVTDKEILSHLDSIFPKVKNGFRDNVIYDVTPKINEWE